jgi:hypothetical protein
MVDDMIVDDAQKLIGKEGMGFGNLVSGRRIRQQPPPDFVPGRGKRAAQQLDHGKATLLCALLFDDRTRSAQSSERRLSMTARGRGMRMTLIVSDLDAPLLCKMKGLGREAA